MKKQYQVFIVRKNRISDSFQYEVLNLATQEVHSAWKTFKEATWVAHDLNKVGRI